MDIDLTAETIGTGGSRLCYAYPGDPSKCVKICRPDHLLKKQTLRRRLKFWIARKIPLFNLNWHEYIVWKRYAQHDQIPGFRDFLPLFHDLVKTPLGLALVMECVRDDNGSISESLKTWYPKASGADREIAMAQCEHLRELVLTNTLPCFDWGPQNLLVQYQNGKFQLKLIDFEGALGNNESIPVSTIIPALKRAKINRRITRGLFAWLATFDK